MLCKTWKTHSVPWQYEHILANSLSYIGRHSGDLCLLCPIAGPSTVPIHKTPDLVMNFRMPNPSMACIDPCLYFVKYQNTPTETPVVESDYPLKNNHTKSEFESQ